VAGASGSVRTTATGPRLPSLKASCKYNAGVLLKSDSDRMWQEQVVGEDNGHGPKTSLFKSLL